MKKKLASLFAAALMAITMVPTAATASAAAVRTAAETAPVHTGDTTATTKVTLPKGVTYNAKTKAVKKNSVWTPGTNKNNFRESYFYLTSDMLNDHYFSDVDSITVAAAGVTEWGISFYTNEKDQNNNNKYFQSFTSEYDNTTYTYKRIGMWKNGAVTIKTSVMEGNSWRLYVNTSSQNSYLSVTYKLKPNPAQVKVTAKKTTSTAAKLTWGKVKDAEQYIVEYKNVTFGDTEYRRYYRYKKNKYGYMENVPITNTSVTVGDLLPGSTYSFRIKTIRGTLESKWKVVTVKTTGKAKLETPKIYSAYVSWVGVPNVKEYEIMYSLNGGKKWLTVKSTTNNYNFTYTKKAKVTFKVRAVAGKVKSGWSGPKTVELY